VNWTRQSAVTARAGVRRGWLTPGRYPAGTRVNARGSGRAGVPYPAAQVAVAAVEAVGNQPGGHPGRVRVAAGHHVVDVVDTAGGRLRLQVVDDERAQAGPAPGRVDKEGDLRVAPHAVQPAVTGHGAVVVADVPPLVGHRL